MNKTYYILTLVFVLSTLISSSNARAQSVDKEAESAARETCECMNEFFNELHPALLRLMHDMAEKSEEEAQVEFMEYLSNASEADQLKIQEDIVRMQNSEIELKTYCEGIEERYAKFDSNDEFQEKMILNLKSTENCSLVRKMMQLGEGIEED
jgi:hypothetical protein